MPHGKANPFLGLKPYELKDRQKLYGRDKDLLLMKDRIFSARTTLLFAGSGVGKTSFLNAKIIPELDPQYFIVYHNQWATDEPLVALTKSLTARFIIEEAAESALPDSTAGQTLIERLGRFKKAAPEGGTGNLKNRCLLILDQFEEIFQYHAYEKYFSEFIEELSAVINAPDCNVRVLFSMREEFLGELSVFDNNIPDLFNNYYRLKCPNKLEAGEIIERTCSFANVETDQARLTDLVTDLARIERGEPIAADSGSSIDAEEAFIDRDLVELPYLQIACQRLWDRQFSAEPGATAGTFPADYQTGNARRMLKLFCHEKLSSLNDSERAILADAFDFLVTKKGAKIAYELSSLAEHMQVNEDVLKSVLLKLSKPDSRILRESKGPDGSLWFELYHDMYGSIIDEWKRTYRLNQRASFRKKIKRAGLFMGATLGVMLLVAGSIAAINHWYLEPHRNQETLRNARLEEPKEYQKNHDAYIRLKGTLGYEKTAKELWAQAWKRRAHLAERQGNAPEALLFLLMAAAEGPPEQETSALSLLDNYWTQSDYKSLLATVRMDPGNEPRFSSDGKTLFGVTADRRVLQWDTASGLTTSESKSLQLEDARDQRDQRPNGQGPARVPFIRAAVGNLVAGFEGNSLDRKFYIWKLDTGSLLWSSPATDKATTADGSGGQGVGYGFDDPDDFSPIFFSRDGKYFATLDRNTAQIYHLTLDDKQPVFPADQPVPSVAAGDFSPDNHTLLLVFIPASPTEYLFQLRDLNNKAVQTFTLKSPIQRATFSPDGTKLLLEFADGARAQIWDIASGSHNEVQTWFDRGLSLYFLADNKTLAACTIDSRDGNRVLNITLSDSDRAYRGSRISTLDAFNSCVFSPDGKSLLTRTDTGASRLWSIAPSEGNHKQIKDSAKLSRAAMSDNGHTIATLNTTDEIKIWNADDATQTGRAFSVVASEAVPLSSNGIYEGYSDELVMNDRGQFVCGRSQDGQLIVWDIGNQREIPMPRSDKGPIGPVAFSPNGDIFAAAMPEMVVKLWQDLGSGSPKAMTWAQANVVKAMVFSPDGKYLAAFCEKDKSGDPSGRLVKVFDIGAGSEVSLGTPTEKVSTSTSAFSNNGSFIASNQDNVAYVWNLNTHKVLELQHSTPVAAVAISANGAVALTVSIDGSMQLWNASTGATIGTEEKYIAKIRAVQISADGKTALAFANQWIYFSSISDKGLEYHGAQLTTPMFYEVPRVLDAAGTAFRNLNFPSPELLAIDDIRSSTQTPVAKPTVSAMTLLDIWQRKLSLTFNDRGEISSKPAFRPGAH